MRSVALWFMGVGTTQCFVCDAVVWQRHRRQRRRRRTMAAIFSSRLVFVLVIWIWVNLVCNIFSFVFFSHPLRSFVYIGAQLCENWRLNRVQSSKLPSKIGVVVLLVVDVDDVVVAAAAAIHTTHPPRCANILSLAWFCCQFFFFGGDSHRVSAMFVVSLAGAATNKDVILDFCRFSYAINMWPLCVLLKLFKHSIRGRICASVCIFAYSSVLVCFTGHLTLKFKTFACCLHSRQIKSAHTFYTLVVEKLCVWRVFVLIAKRMLSAEQLPKEETENAGENGKRLCARNSQIKFVDKTEA